MKKYFLSTLLLIFLVLDVGFGQGIDLSNYSSALDEHIETASGQDKDRLSQIKLLLKKDLTEKEVENIQNAANSLETDLFRNAVKDILIKEGLICVNFIRNRDVDKNDPQNLRIQLEILIQQYEKQKLMDKNIKQKDNYPLLKSMVLLLDSCVVGTDLLTISNTNDKLNKEGKQTTEFIEKLTAALDANQYIIDNVKKQTKEEVKVIENPKIEELENDKEPFNTKTYLLYAFLAISILANCYFLYNNFIKKTKKETDNVVNKSAKNNNSTAFEKQELESLRSKNKELEQEISKVKSQLDFERNRIKDLQFEKEKLNKSNQNIPIINPRKQKTSKQKPQSFNYDNVQFFASPNEQGEFIAKNGQNDVKQGASIYKFYINGSEAEFEFFNHTSTFLNTLNNPNRLNAVCNFINNYNPDATKIATSKKGKAILQGDKWKVTQKAEIRYEA